MSDLVFDKALKMAKGTWQNAKAKAATSGFGSDVEDGRYKATITKAELGMSKTSSRLQVAWTYSILEGEFKGKTKMDWDGADTLDNQMWLGRKLARLGYEIPDDLDEVKDVLVDIVKSKLVIRITVKTKGEFQKVYVDEVLESEEAEAEAPAEEAVAEEAEAVELEVGANVSFTLKGEEVTGEVTELGTDNTAKVKLADGKAYRLPIDKLTLVEVVPEEPVEEEPVEEVVEEEKPKVTKKTSKPTAKKTAKKRK